MKIVVLPLGEIAACVADRVEALLADKPEAVLGMTTGTTPLATRIYKELLSENREESCALTLRRSLIRMNRSA